MNLERAMQNCKVRGYIAREQWPPHRKEWKNTLAFDELPDTLGVDDATADDWNCFDPEGEETSIVG
jgi:hypothetical protein